MLADKTKFPSGVKLAVENHTVCVQNARSQIFVSGGSPSMNIEQCCVCLSKALVYKCEAFNEIVKVCMICAQMPNSRRGISSKSSFEKARDEQKQAHDYAICVFAYEWWQRPATISTIDACGRACALCGKLYRKIQYTRTYTNKYTRGGNSKEITHATEYSFCHICAEDISTQKDAFARQHIAYMRLIPAIIFVIPDIARFVTSILVCLASGANTMPKISFSPEINDNAAIQVVPDYKQWVIDDADLCAWNIRSSLI